MSKFQNYLKTFDITSTLTEEDIDKTLALLQIYGPAVRRTASRIGEMEEECYEIAKILTHEGIPTPTGKKPCWTISSVTYILGNDRYCGDVIMQKSLCVDLFAHKRVRNLGQVERYRMRDVHPPLISKEEWREAKNRISMPDREAVILEEITGEGILSSLHPILFKEDIDV